ncbi:MAG: hypothetical protein JW940_36130 [Polyangiaceae bacterium]|nr:hypothetical protein [Polyangiaceae bacterium]
MRLARRNRSSGRQAWVDIALKPEALGALVLPVAERAMGLAVETLGSAVAATPGSVRVEVELSNGSILTRDLKLAAGQQQTVDFGEPNKEEAPILTPRTAEPARPPPPVAAPKPDESGAGLRTASYVAAGVGAVGLAGFGVFALMTRSTYRDLEADCHGGTCPEDRQSDIDAGETYQLFANIGLGVAAAGLATGVVLFVLTRPGEKPAPSVVLCAAPQGLGVKGQF